MKHPALLLVAPLLLGALHVVHASVTKAPTAAPGPPPSEALPLEALETPAPPDDPSDVDDEEPAGPRFSGLVSWSGDVDAFTPPPGVLADDPPSDEHTPAPTATEWRYADEVALARDARGCKARRVREWLRIACRVPGDVAAMDLLAGPRDGVSFQAAATWRDESAVVFPVRRGDRRVLQMVHVASASKYSVDYDTAFAISEDWLADASGPTVVVD